MPRITPVHWRILERVFTHVGFEFARQVGSHRIYTRANAARPVVIPTYREIPIYIIEKNLKTAELSRNDYLCLLRELT